MAANILVVDDEQAIAREIVAAHGGTIEAASTPEATVFTVKLP